MLKAVSLLLVSSVAWCQVSGNTHRQNAPTYAPLFTIPAVNFDQLQWHTNNCTIAMSYNHVAIGC